MDFTAYTVRVATIVDKEPILGIAREYPRELGYVHPVSMQERIERGEVYVAEDNGVIVGFVAWHKRKDNWHTIYDLAVSKQHSRRGIGKLLLYSVQPPVRLKCPVDNVSNEFYQAAGMELVSQEPGKKRALNIWEMRVLCVLVAGNNKVIPEIANRAGWAYGTRHDMKPSHQPFMLDINWKKYDWQEYLSLVSLYRPIQAMVADYESDSQRELMLSQIEDLRNLGIMRIMVCPKFDGAINDIPPDCVIAVSVPTRHAGFVPDMLEIGNRPVHLLGGTPKKVGSFLSTLNVISWDTNTQFSDRSSNMIFTGDKWIAIRKHEQSDYYQNALISSINMRKFAQNFSKVEQLTLGLST